MIILLRLLLFVFVDFILILCLFPIGILFLAGPRNVEFGNKTDKLIVLIHGSGVGEWQWNVAKAYLCLFRLSHMTVGYDSSKRVDISCQNVWEQIPLDREVALIGHSQGGLIARSIANNLNATKIFFLNTPQKGSPLLDWLYPIEENKIRSDSDIDMRYGSDFIKKLPTELKSETFEIVGINDFVRDSQSIFYGKNIYHSWFGHYFSAVNPYLWIQYITPELKK